MKFDLTKEAWIPVDRAGRTVEVSLEDLFSNPAEFRDLASVFGQERVALTRVLVALLQSAVPEPIDHRLKERWMEDPSPCSGTVREYLDRWRHRFDLFDSERPFMQQPVGSAAARETTVASLGLDMASGNNVTLFDHSVDSRPPSIRPGRAVRMLLTTLLCQPGGGVSRPFNRCDSPGTRSVMAMAVGGDLWQTLLANCPSLEARDLEARPAWERDFDRDRPDPQGGVPAGWLDLATWRSRAVQLLPEADGRVRFLRMHQHLKLAGGAPRDPFVPVRRKPGEEPVALRLSPSRRTWQQADAIYHGLAGGRQPSVVQDAAWLFEGVGLPLKVFVSGLEVNQSKISDSRGAVLPVSSSLLSDAGRLELIGRAIELAQGGAGALFAACRAYGEVVGNDNVGELARRLQEPYWAGLEQAFSRFADDVATASGDSGLGREPWSDWTAAVRESAMRGEDDFERLGGNVARQLQALVSARAALRRTLNRKVPSVREEEIARA